MNSFCNSPFKIELLGLIAGALSTLSFVPQLLLIWKTKSTRDISLGMYSLYTCSLILWGVYACLTHSWALLITEIITIKITFYIIVMKVKELRNTKINKENNQITNKYHAQK